MIEAIIFSILFIQLSQRFQTTKYLVSFMAQLATPKNHKPIYSRILIISFGILVLASSGHCAARDAVPLLENWKFLKHDIAPDQNAENTIQARANGEKLSDTCEWTLEKPNL